MKRKYVLLVLAACLALPLAAYDFGATLDNSTAVGYAGETTVLQEDKLALWFSTGIGKFLEFTAQGSFTFTYEKPSIFEYLLDVDLFHLSGSFLREERRSSLLRFVVGRFLVRDFSGLVLDDRIDGFQLGWHSSLANFDLALGTSILQLDALSTIAMSWADVNNATALAPPRIIGSLAAEFPELFGKQDLLICLLLQQDFRAKDELIAEGSTIEILGQGGRLSTQYLGVGFRGPALPSFYYSAFAFLGTGRTLSYIDGSYQYTFLLSTLFGTGIRYFREDALNTRAELSLLLSSGDADYADFFIEANRAGRATMFVPISIADLALVFSPRLGNVALVKASYSIKPIASLQTLLTAFLFLRPTTGPISDSRIDPASDSIYLGSEIDLEARFRPFSDLGMVFSAGVFVPGKEAFRDTNEDPEFRGRFEISLSL